MSAFGMDSEDQLTEGKLFATFERYREFYDLQTSLLSRELSQEPTAEDGRAEDRILQRLTLILSEYQEQAYLLDPFLEDLVAPVVEVLKRHAAFYVANPHNTLSGERVNRVALLLYNYVKFRGHKTITRFFPHEIADLSIALNYIISPEGPIQDFKQWSLRYVVLLWLSLICMIPFDLEQFDERDSVGETAEKIETVGKSYLGKAGIEREAAAILLSRLYMRKDMSAKFLPFLQWSISTVRTSSDPFPMIGVLHISCEVTKSGSVEQITSHSALLLEVVHTLQGNQISTHNTIIRKLQTKLISRVVLRLLPARVSAARSKGRALSGHIAASGDDPLVDADDDTNIPEEVETTLEELFKALQDKDTVVRWSSAKGIARISERLPTELAEQVLDTVLGLFSIHSMAAASLYDMPALAEATWHGTCLACAEMARRGLVADEKLAELIDWLSKALYFDIRKGAHSIGSSVRDAASYVLWSLARAQGVAALAPHAKNLAQRLVAVSLFDREVHIRRAASATFQEYVGRTSLFMHGIDVLRKTDFYAVGVRRNAFLVAAPEVAEHNEYRSFLINHLLTITLRHWDTSMRELGAESLRAICQPHLSQLGSTTAHSAARLLKLPDASDVHGGLLALTKLAIAFHSSPVNGDKEAERRKIFSYLADVPIATVQSSRHELVTAAACHLIASSITVAETQAAQSSVPHWRAIVDFGLKSRTTAVQEAAAAALAAVSKLVDCSAIVQRLIREFSDGSPPMQQSLYMVLGVLDYTAYPHSLLVAIQSLLASVNRSATTRATNVEARRNAYLSLARILTTVSSNIPEHLSSSTVCQMLDAMLDGLDDYTTDERGDVGSWIRIACVKSLTVFAEILFAQASSLPDLAQYFPAPKYHRAVAGILKQGVERLDNVRQQAGESFLRLLLLPLPAVPNAATWRIQGDEYMKGLFLSVSETIGWNDSAWLFPRAVQLLDIEAYRGSILTGLVLSTSSRTDSTQRPVSSSLVAYARTLPVTTTEINRYDLRGLAQDLVTQATRNITSNNIVIPVLQAFNILLEADVFERLPEDSVGLKSLKSLLSVASKNVSNLKNPQRILMSMKIVINILPMAQLQSSCISQLPNFLTHRYPKVRSDTAEYLYLVLQSKDLGYETDEAEDILLETEWSSSDSASIADATRRCVELLSEAS
ncbi:ARM repeat-containing protein [Amylocystis lapponica]|nr:ARM repeat-containing protein [Amylocystis lapponica]